MEWQAPVLVNIGAGTDAEKRCTDGSAALGWCSGGGARFYDVCYPGPDLAWEICVSGGTDGST